MGSQNNHIGCSQNHLISLSACPTFVCMKEAKHISTLPVSLFSGTVVLVVGGYIGYQLGLHAYDELLIDELLADMYYADNPVDCPPCKERKTYEWFYVEPPVDNHLPEGAVEAAPAKQEGGKDMGP